MFSGDRSGEWLFRAMHKSGFANQPNSDHLKDGLELIDSAITNICRCAPPDNKPKPDELKNCRPFLVETFELCQPIVVLALGSMAWKATMNMAIDTGWYQPPRPRPKFGHGQQIQLSPGRWMIGSYHPSQQNTFTGRLTRPMFDSVFQAAKRLIKKSRKSRGS
jgi:uracil-DNA glycosylase